jgi:hypothetical protein
MVRYCLPRSSTEGPACDAAGLQSRMLEDRTWPTLGRDVIDLATDSFFSSLTNIIAINPE